MKSKNLRQLKRFGIPSLFFISIHYPPIKYLDSQLLVGYAPWFLPQISVKTTKPIFESHLLVDC